MFFQSDEQVIAVTLKMRKLAKRVRGESEVLPGSWQSQAQPFMGMGIR
jgi:hypothetical protein